MSPSADPHVSEPRHQRLADERAAEAAESGTAAPTLHFERQADGTIRGRCEACGCEIPVEVA